MTGLRPRETQQELGAFLRSRRERLRPDQVGLPTTGRRRTPGLRREEVAVLAGVGVTWYTWLEQGRSINVSTQVLASVGRALRLDDAELRHMERLAGVRAESNGPVGLDAPMSAAYQPVLDKLDPYPACLQTNAFDIVAYNSSYRFLFTDMNQIPPPERNCALQFFTDEEWRRRYIDDEVVASRMVAQLRSAVGSTTNSGAGQTIKELQLRSDEFAELWSRHDVLFQHLETKRLDSPVVGELDLNFVTTNVAETGYRLTVMTPADETTSQRLTQLSELTADARI